MIEHRLSNALPWAVVFVEAAAQHSGEVRDQAHMRLWLDAHLNVDDEYPDMLPHTVATTVHIEEHRRFSDGRFLLYGHGDVRIRLTGITQRTPYLIASAEPWPSESSPAAKAATVAMHDLHQRFWRTLARIGGRDQTPVPQLSSDPVQLSWQLAELMHIAESRKQEWLCMSTALRIRSMIRALRAELATYPMHAPSIEYPAPWSWN
jgi:Lon protease-like protein